jgi:hypothetical protein
MDISDRDQAAYDAVDDALLTYPLDDAPETIFAAVMGQIKTAEPLPRFQLTWLDYALSLFMAGMVGLLWFLWQSITLPPHWAARLSIQILHWWHRARFSTAYLLPEIGGSFGLGLGLLLLVIVAIEFRRRFLLIRMVV